MIHPSVRATDIYYQVYARAQKRYLTEPGYKFGKALYNLCSPYVREQLKNNGHDPFNLDEEQIIERGILQRLYEYIFQEQQKTIPR